MGAVSNDKIYICLLPLEPMGPSPEEEFDKIKWEFKRANKKMKLYDVITSAPSEALNDEEKKKLSEYKKDLMDSNTNGWNPPLPSSDSKIWRYINFTQLLSILERSKMWFSSTSSFNDPYEGLMPKENIESRINDIIEMIDVDRQEAKILYKAMSLENAGKGFVNCWNINDHESAALWEQYLEASQGVAITSTVEDIREAFHTDRELTFGKVEYINYQSKRIPEGQLPPIYHKRKSFEHEDEFRVSFVDSDSDEKGEYINVDVERLINEIYFPPVSQSWFFDLIEDVSDTYGLDCEFQESEIHSRPGYSP